MTGILVWLITGTSSGLGRDLAIAALRRGEKVIATGRARSVSQLDDLKARGADVLELDVTAPLDKLQEIAKEAVSLHGRIDVLVNNAGYILAGAMEGNTPQETFDQYNTNVFGALNVTRAFLPYMREKKSGTIVFMGSIGGWRSVPNAGIYASTKYALRGLSLTLHDEISPLGLRSTCIDFGYFRTSFLAGDHRAPKVTRIADYEPIVAKAEAALDAYNGHQPGNPKKGVEIVLDIVRDEGVAKDRPFPVEMSLGSDCFGTVKSACENTLARLNEWEDVIKSTDFAAA